MGSSEKFCLRWNDFERNISGSFQELRNDKDFFDVTLACDDEQIKAHKVILAACSPFFRTLFRRNKHEHPLLYLKGVKFADLVSVLDFMYHGEVNVAQEELNSFLAVAEDLQVKGLTQNGSNSMPTNVQKEKPKKLQQPRVPQSSFPPKHSRPPPPPVPRLPPNTHHAEEDDIHEVVPVKSEPISSDQSYAVAGLQEDMGYAPTENTVVHEEYEEYSEYQEVDGGGTTEMEYTQQTGQTGSTDLDELISGYMSKTKNQFGKTEWVCNICGKQGAYKRAIKCHVETHLEGVEKKCPYCVKKPKTTEALRVHIMDYHKSQQMAAHY